MWIPFQKNTTANNIKQLISCTACSLSYYSSSQIIKLLKKQHTPDSISNLETCKLHAGSLCKKALK